MKRQVVVIVSIALLSFLLGTLVSMSLTATGIMANPFENRLSMTSELHTKIIKFHEPNERNVTNNYQSTDPINAVDRVTFVWTPDNPNENAVLFIFAYCEYRVGNPLPIVWQLEGTFSWEIRWGIRINEFGWGFGHFVAVGAQNQQQWEQKAPFEWTQIAFPPQPYEIPNTFPRGLWMNPNQNHYNLTFETNHQDRAGGSTPTYVRNINVIIEVIDG